MTSKVNIILGLVVSTLLFIIAPLTANASSSAKVELTAEDISLKLNNAVYLVPDSSFMIEDDSLESLVTYTGTGINRYSITANGYDFMDGNVFIKTTFYYGSASAFEDNFYFDVVPRVEMDGLDIFTYSFVRDTVNCTYTLIYGVKFTNFVPTSGVFFFDVYYDITASAMYHSGFDKVIGVTMASSPTGSWTLHMVEDIINTNSVEGDSLRLFREWFADVDSAISSLKENIISSISVMQSAIVNSLTLFQNDSNAWFTNIYNRIWDTHNAMTETVNSFKSTVVSNFSGLVSKLNSWFTTLFEKMDNEHEEIINGYDSSTNNEAAGQLNDSMTQAMEKEDAVNQQANGYVDGYTINGDGVAGYATQFLTVFPLVSSMMQSIFDSSGAFGIIFSVIFTMTIVCMFIGMFRWYKS